MSTLSFTVPRSAEKPVNGFAGLKHWRYDVMAGLMVSLTSLPLSLGIAVASGAPPISGLISAIIAGLVFPFLGGAYVTISGPAAGLAPALLATMTMLGHGNREIGYPMLLAVISMVGVIQIGLSRIGAARFSAAFPAAVVEGMLASIGMMIIAKQMPHFLGHEFHAHEFFGIVLETPIEIPLLQPRVFAIGAICLVTLFVLASRRARARWTWLNYCPPPLLVVMLGIVLGRLLSLDSAFLIHMPEKAIHGIVAPNFAGLWADKSIWGVATIGVLTLVLIDGVESLATIAAIDKIDPFRRKSNPDQTLFAMGVSNLCSSLFGGLTIIPGGVKSKLCINSGGRTLWANFFNACFLLAFLFLARPLIDLIPYSALAAVLIYTGWKMCEPAVWKHVAHIGKEQLFLFATTVAITLWTDLLWGILGGMAAKLLLNMTLTSRLAGTREGSASMLSRLATAPVRLPQLFKSPVVGHDARCGEYHVYLDRPLVCFNAIHVRRELSRVPPDAREVVLHLRDGVTLIDHTSCENLLHFAEEFERTGRGAVTLVGFDHLIQRGGDSTSLRVAPARRFHVNGVPATLQAVCDSHEPAADGDLSEVASVD
jgi:MFS superfamily sulfate permease-like transporter